MAAAAGGWSGGPPMSARGVDSGPAMAWLGHCAMAGGKCGPGVRADGGDAVQLGKELRTGLGSSIEWKCPLPIVMESGGCGRSAIMLEKGFGAEGEACWPSFGC